MLSGELVTSIDESASLDGMSSSHNSTKSLSKPSLWCMGRAERDLASAAQSRLRKEEEVVVLVGEVSESSETLVRKSVLV